jgi:aldehyde dehydrogenase (NAD+)
MGERYRNLLDGKWIDSAGESTFDDVNPANKGDVLGSFPRSDHRDIDRAVEGMRSHCASWAGVPRLRRGEILYAAAGRLGQRVDDLAPLLTRETGKTHGESRAEVESCVAALRHVAAELVSGGDSLEPSRQAGSVTIASRVPVGVGAVITHWGFPLAGPAWHLATMLAAGNPVVFKPSEHAPLVATRLVELLLDSGVAPGAISLVHGPGEDAGAPLVRHPDVALVSLVGSPDVGREVAIACAAEQKRLLLDMGERCAIVVQEDADLEAAACGALRGGLSMAGQRWRGISRLVIHRKVLKEFTERLLGRVQSLRPGDGMLPDTNLGPLIAEAHLKQMHACTRIVIKEGGKVLSGGEVVREGECRRGFFYAPTVYGDLSAKARIAQETVGGPALALLPVSGAEEALEVATAGTPGLALALYSRDVRRTLRLVDGLRCGRIHVNLPAASDEASDAFSGFTLGRARRDAAAHRLDACAAWKLTTLGGFGERASSRVDVRKESDPLSR